MDFHVTRAKIETIGFIWKASENIPNHFFLEIFTVSYLSDTPQYVLLGVLPAIHMIWFYLTEFSNFSQTK